MNPVMDRSKDWDRLIIRWAPHLKFCAFFLPHITEGPETKATNPPQCEVIKGSDYGARPGARNNHLKDSEAFSLLYLAF